MSWVAVGGAAVGAAGSLLGGSESAPKIKMYDVASDLGNIDFIKRGGGDREIKLSLSQPQQQLYDQYQRMAMEYGGGGPQAGMLQDAMGRGGASALANFGAAQANTPSFNPYAQFLSGMGGLNQAAMMSGMQGAGQNVAQPYAGQLFGMGQQLAGRDYNQVYQDRLGLLREQAAPYEERAQNSFMNKLFSMGQLGAGSTAGNLKTEAFGRGIGQADTTRQLDAMNLSEALYGRDLAAGQGMMGTGLQGIIGGYNAGTSRSSNMFDLARLGMGGQLTANQQFEALQNARAQQRMTNAMDLFGFGQQGLSDNMRIGSNAQMSGQNIYDALQAQAQLSASGAGVGMAQSSTPGAPQWQQALGGAMSGFGGAMMANPGSFDFGNLFGSKGGTPSGGVIGFGSGADGFGGNIFGNAASSWGLGG